MEKTIAFKRQLNVIREDIQSNNSQSDESPSSTSAGSCNVMCFYIDCFRNPNTSHVVHTEGVLINKIC